MRERKIHRWVSNVSPPRYGCYVLCGFWHTPRQFTSQSDENTTCKNCLRIMRLAHREEEERSEEEHRRVLREDA